LTADVLDARLPSPGRGFLPLPACRLLLLGHGVRSPRVLLQLSFDRRTGRRQPTPFWGTASCSCRGSGWPAVSAARAGRGSTELIRRGSRRVFRASAGERVAGLSGPPRVPRSPRSSAERAPISYIGTAQVRVLPGALRPGARECKRSPLHAVTKPSRIHHC